MSIDPGVTTLYSGFSLLAPEGEIYASDILEDVLAGGIADDMIRPKVGVQIIHFDGPDLYVSSDCPIQPGAAPSLSRKLSTLIRPSNDRTFA